MLHCGFIGKCTQISLVLYQVPVFLIELIVFKERGGDKQKKNLMEAVMLCRKPYCFTHICLIASVHYKESLVWFKVSNFSYTIDPGPSLVFSWLSCCCRVLWRSGSFGSSGWVPSCWGGPSQPWFWAWVVAGLVSLPALPSSPPG